MDQQISDILEAVTFIRDRMVGKEDVTDIIRGEVPEILGAALSPIRAELFAIRRELDDLHDKFENVSGFRKEIDHALERIATIEKRLGLGRKMTA